jgi:hypothetical protein
MKFPWHKRGYAKGTFLEAIKEELAKIFSSRR